VVHLLFMQVAVVVEALKALAQVVLAAVAQVL
jgi:hypothetical protein